MTTTYRDVVSHTMETFVAEVVALTLDGFTVDPVNKGDVIGLGQYFTVRMMRNEATVEAARVKLAQMGEQPKRTRAEQLADARKHIGKAKLDTTKVR